MQIPPKGPSSIFGTNTINQTKSTSNTSNAQFQNLVNGVKQLASSEGVQGSSLLPFTKNIAMDFSRGAITEQQACRKFVDVVIDNRFSSVGNGQVIKSAKEAVATLLESDPQFVSRLSVQLKKIASSTQK